MDVDAALEGNIDYSLGKYQAIGNNHHKIRAKAPQLFDGFGILEGFGLENGDSRGFGHGLDRRGNNLAAPALGAVRLGINGNNLMIGCDEGFEWGDGKFRCSGEDDLHELSPEGDGPPLLPRCSFLTLRRASCLFSGDR